MVSNPVAISGTVGKQVYPTSNSPITLQGFNLSPLSAAAFVRIREGNASGAIAYEGSVPANQTIPVQFADEGHRFTKGMHVKVLGGTGAVCYLWIN